MTVLEITTTLRRAAADPRVRGLILAFNESVIEHRSILSGEVIESHLGAGVLGEIQQAIANFRREKQAARLHELQDTVDELRAQKDDINRNIDRLLGSGEEKNVSEENDNVEIIKETHDEKEDDGYDFENNVVIAVADNYCTRCFLCSL